MKKNLIIIVFLLSTLPQIAADLTFGIYGGKDLYRIDDLERGFNLIDLTQASVSRTGFGNPWLFGVDLAYGLGKGFYFDFTAEGVYLKYDLNYTVSFPLPHDPFNKETNYYSVEWARFAFLLSLQKTVVTTDFFDFYLGVGGGLHLIAPVVSDKFLMMTLKDKFDKFDPSTDVSLEQKIGGNASLGFVVHPFSVPLKFKLEGKYTTMPPGDYEEPNSFFSVFAGIIYSINL